MKSTAAWYDGLKAYIDSLPIIDCHDHAKRRVKIADVLVYFATGYFRSDLHAASSDADIAIIADASLSIEERWPIFEKAWNRSKYTGYGLHVRRAVKRVFGVEEITLQSVIHMQEAMPDFSDPVVYDAFYTDAKIVARIADVWPPMDEILDGSYQTLPNQRLVIGLPGYHMILSRGRSLIPQLEKNLGRAITSLDDYLEACGTVFDAYKRLGAVAFKDQSAYGRSLAYGNPSRDKAETVFNRIIADPRYSAEYDPNDNPLSDYLVHCFMRMAREMGLPVQVHTGHMAGIRNDVVKTNAAGLRSLIEIHRDVNFDLFHANWPYSGDALFLAKNYPNVSIDFCWTHIIDPLYSRDMLMQAVSAAPHGKIHGFGSDVGGDQPDRAWAHAMIARENIACALAELVTIDYIDMDDAKRIAADWLFHNPNTFFRLGLRIDDV